MSENAIEKINYEELKFAHDIALKRGFIFKHHVERSRKTGIYQYFDIYNIDDCEWKKYFILSEFIKENPCSHQWNFGHPSGFVVCDWCQKIASTNNG